MNAFSNARVTVLLSAYNGAPYLREQLDSLLAQTHRDWTLLWRDDGSADASVAELDAFARRAGQGRCTRLDLPSGNIGIRDSFLTLLRAALPSLGPRDAAAFADQDDLWLPEKLARGMAALGAVPPGVPALACTRQLLVDARLAPIAESPALPRPPGFPAALTQNIATGCTILLNRAAARLIADARAPETSLHDWWSYVVVAAAGGRVLVDDAPLVLYRQHNGNSIGAPATTLRRARIALRRGPAAFMRVFRGHVAALAEQPDLPNGPARMEVARLQRALAGGLLCRLRAIARMPGLRRQTRLETLIFWLWFLLG